MISKPHVLTAKLSPPRIKSQCLFRSRLDDLFLQVIDYPVTLVQAEAGYGKSISLVTHLYVHFDPIAWYSVEDGERDPFQFLFYLIHALKTFDSKIGERSLRLLEQFDWTASVIQPCMTLLLNDLAELAPDPAILVLDDLHTVADLQEIQAILEMLIRYLPAHVHLVIGTRRTLELPAIKRLQSTYDLLVISKQDLLFTTEEISQLFQEQYGILLASEQLQDLQEQTEGWIIALQMVWKGLETGIELSELWRTQPETKRLLFHYLAEEVFDRQPALIRQFLQRTCILERMETDVCDWMMERNDCGEILVQLEREGLFVTGLGEGHYRYHRLFQQFLLTRSLLDDSEEQWFSLHHKAASYYQEKGEIPLALHHYYQAGESGQVVSLLLEWGVHFLQNGRFEMLRNWIDRLSSDVLQQHPQLLFWRGEIDRFSSRFSEAEHWYTLAEGGYIRLGDVLGRSQVYLGQAQLFLDTIQPVKAIRWLEKAVQVLGENYPEEKAKMLRLLAENHTNSGRLQEAEEMLKRAAQLVPGTPKDELDIRIHLRTGRLAAAKQMTLQIIEEEQKASGGYKKRIAKFHREKHLLLSLIQAFMGDVSASRLNAEHGIRIGRELQSPFVEAVGYMRLGHAQALAGRLEEAQVSYLRSIELSESLRVERGKVEALMGLCITSGLLGELEQAEQHGRTGLELALAVHDMWCANMIRLSLGLVRTTWGQYDEALPWLLEAEKGFQACGDRFCLANVRMWLAMLHERTGQETEFARVMPLFLKEVETSGYEYLFLRRTLFGPNDLQTLVPSLLLARDVLKVEAAEKLLGQMGCKGIQKHPGHTLRIYTLGKFAAYRGMDEVGRKEWKREKSRQLFQLLVTRRGQFLQREEIFDLLWPEADEKTAARDFKVALNALITAIEPDREARSESFFIERVDTGYRLQPSATVWIDRDEFEVRAEKGLSLAEQEIGTAGQISRQAIEELESALFLYKGDFLQDYPYQDWCADERERLRTLYLRVLESLARIYHKNGALNEAIGCCDRILSHDPCWEAAYQILMSCYHQLGNRSLVITTYKRCVTQLEDQLGVAPLESTTKLYQQLVRRRT
ncbi:BTAD domain-containing putative transcriptional regulator [Effusibacillus consociatus]|uniref:BTAD domain-containing putative transcriptional regulator n=1 Tax=Effusibacillus consociatus TaxID=1117041 RepID=A0ABV9PYX5_9BACL